MNLLPIPISHAAPGQWLRQRLTRGAGLIILLLLVPQGAIAQQVIDQPIVEAEANAVSGIDLIAQMEAEDAANGTIDSRTEPYMVIQYLALNHQLFLPLVTSGTPATVAVASTNAAMPWPAIAPPGHTLTPEEEAAIAAAHADAEAYVRTFAQAVNDRVVAAGLQATTAIVRTSASIGNITTTKEVNDGAHVNYCGPGALRVAVDAQAPSDWLPDMEHVAAKINQLTSNTGFNPAWGTTDVGMCSYLYRWYVGQRRAETYWVPNRIMFTVSTDTVDHSMALFDSLRGGKGIR
ncbi:MAG: hypothetical protein KF832_27660 [Caldilineaceae bacterium]|nr:hypothetical protein [Caldilineaceae bacterium]